MNMKKSTATERRVRTCGFQRKNGNHLKKEPLTLKSKFKASRKKVDAICDFRLERQKLLSKAGPKHHWD